MSDPTSGGGPTRRPAVYATLVAVPVTVIAVFIAIAASRTSTSDPPLPLAATSAPQAQDPACARLIAALPQTFPGFDPRTDTGGLVQWNASDGNDAGGPVQLRCGVDRPADLAPTSALQTVNPVQWFSSAGTDARGTVWTAVDHRPYVALWSPSNAGSGPITGVSQIIDRALPRGPIDLGR